MDKAYKILSQREGISHKKAKELIDKGLVSINGKKIPLARALIPTHTYFEILKPQNIQKLFEDENLLALFKPAFMESYDLAGVFPDWCLLHRLDRDTSGVILLVKEGSDFHQLAKKAFKNREVYKEYYALVSGFISEERDIDAKISTTKKGFARSRISDTGLQAHTRITPVKIMGKKTLLKVIITTGRTHQIRVHLAHIGHPIVGDVIYKGIPAPRLMLHAHKIKLFDYEITSDLPKSFQGD